MKRRALFVSSQALQRGNLLRARWQCKPRPRGGSTASGTLRTRQSPTPIAVAPSISSAKASMHNLIHREAVELILASMSALRGDSGLESSFFFGKPGAPQWERRMGVVVYYDFSQLTRAALHVRQEGPSYLRYLSMGEIRSKLQQFVIDHYWYLADDTLFQKFEGSYARRVREKAKVDFSEALAQSPIFKPGDELTLLPLSTVKVESDFEADTFFLIAPPSLSGTKLLNHVRTSVLMPSEFPPLADWKGRREMPSAWLGIKSPTFKAASKMKAAILGALALTPLPRYRHRFSGRDTIKGRCTFGPTGVTSSYDEVLTPPLMTDIMVGEQDLAWLAILAKMFASNEPAIRRQLSALEYFYRAWALDESERFPILCMAIDAVLSTPKQATASVIEGVRKIVGAHVDGKRLRTLMRIRGDVIHGRAPDVYDSEEYAPYYACYGEDPIRDMELVVGCCLRGLIFDDLLREHADPNADVIAQLQASGRLPKVLDDRTILDGPPSPSSAAK